MVPERERQQLLAEWNHTAAEYPRTRCLHELFEERAARTPERTAVRCGVDHLTYRELNARANRLARTLRQAGVAPDDRVGLCVERGAGMIAALLGILKAGGAYVPLSADHPKARLAIQLAGAAALVTEEQFLPALPKFAGPTICVDRGASWETQPSTNLETLTTSENLCYVIYTSGSTGVPKGVAVRHRNLVNYACFIQRFLELDRYPDGLDFATVSTLSADLGNTAIFPSLLSGGCLHIVQQDVATDPQQMSDSFSRYPVDVLKIVPSHLEALLDAGGGAGVLPRRYLILGGEALSRELAARITALAPACEIINHYGPTETTVGSLALRLRDYDWKAPANHGIPIGRPIANTRAYILDARQQPVPPGVTGELYLAGDGVAAGYIGQPELTAERFVAEPFAGDGAARMYKTGDRARYLADGNVEFLGRSDDQVKIRGFRIELGEIEAVLSGHPGVRRAVALARENDRGDKYLVAYVTGSAHAELDAEDLRTYAGEHLPEYMLPGTIVVLPKLPLSANGKVDRQALPAPEETGSPAVEYVPPSGATEELVVSVWSEVLRRSPIGVQDDFFDIGGHSLLATRIASRLREQFHVPVTVRMVFECPTVRSLTAAIMRLDSSESAAIALLPLEPPGRSQ
jgi:amino acid adenylation domain-containing protein